MSKLSHNAAMKVLLSDDASVPVSDPQGPAFASLGLKFDLWAAERRFAQEMARKCLLGPHAETKEWSLDLGVADRIVRRWASGAQLIPESRIPQIVSLYHRYRMRSRDLDAEIDAAVDGMLTRVYGAAKGSM